MSDDERREMDAVITSMSISQHRILLLHTPEGWGRAMRCTLCKHHGDTIWPCRTVKALEPWRWDVEGKRKEDGGSTG